MTALCILLALIAVLAVGLALRVIHALRELSKENILLRDGLLTIKPIDPISWLSASVRAEFLIKQALSLHQLSPEQDHAFRAAIDESFNWTVRAYQARQIDGFEKDREARIVAACSPN